MLSQDGRLLLRQDICHQRNLPSSECGAKPLEAIGDGRAESSVCHEEDRLVLPQGQSRGSAFINHSVCKHQTWRRHGCDKAWDGPGIFIWAVSRPILMQVFHGCVGEYCMMAKCCHEVKQTFCQNVHDVTDIGFCEAVLVLTGQLVVAYRISQGYVILIC